MKKQNRNKKIVALIAIILVIIILTIIITTNVIKNNNVNNESYLATANANSDLVASYIKSGVTIGGITGTLETIDVSNATATAEDVLEGKTFYAGSNEIKTGTMKSSSTLKRASTSYNPNSWSGTKTINVESSLEIPSEIADTLDKNNFVAIVNSLNWTRDNRSASGIRSNPSITSYNSETHNLVINHSTGYTEAIITSITVVAFWIE